MAEQRESRARWLSAPGGALALLLLAVTIQKIWAVDTWWQLKTGEWIRTHRAVPTIDVFSHTAAGNPCIETRWVYMLALDTAWRIGGPALVGLCGAAAVGLAFAIVIWPTGGRRIALSLPGAALIALALFGGASRWVVRPELISYILAPLFLVMLEAHSRGRIKHAAWWLVLAQVVWANSHSFSILGPAFAWGFAFAEPIRRRLHGDPTPGGAPFTRSILLALAITAACWINPYFHIGAMVPFTLYRDAAPLRELNIYEMAGTFSRPILSWTWDQQAALILAGVVALTFLARPRRLDPARLGVFAIGLILGSMAQRGVGIFVILALWIGLANLRDRAAEQAQTRATDLPGSAGQSVLLKPLTLLGHGLLAAASLSLAWYVATDRFAIRFNAPRESGLGVVHWKFPEAAAGFLAREPVRPNLYNAMVDGGYLVYRLAGTLPVYIDGRTDVYGVEILREALRPQGFTLDELFIRRNINVALLPTEGADDFIRALAARPQQWALCFLDHRAVVYLRRIPEHADIIARTELTQARPPAADPDLLTVEESPDPWKRAIGAPAASRPWHSLGMARALILTGFPAAAEPFVRRGLSRFPDHYELRFLHASLRLSAGDYARAMPALESLHAESPGDAQVLSMLIESCLASNHLPRARDLYPRLFALRPPEPLELANLGMLHEQAGDRAAAIDAYQRALALDGSLYQVHNQLGTVLAQQGDRAGAERAFRRALELKPDYAPARNNLGMLGVR